MRFKTLFLVLVFGLVFLYTNCGSSDARNRNRGDNQARFLSARSAQCSTSAFNHEIETIKYDIPYGDYDENRLNELTYDLYLPKVNKKVPLVIFAHSGAFFMGDKGANNMVELCEDFAKAGYASATINYRLLSLPKNWMEGLEAVDFVQYSKKSIYNALRDVRASVRHFKAKSEIYQIDTNNIFLGGYSAGGILSLHAAYTNDREAKHIFSLPKYETCLDCVGGNEQYSSDVRGVISMAGGMFDGTHIEHNDNTPACLIHGDKDGIVPCKTGWPFEKYVKDDISFDIPLFLEELCMTNASRNSLELNSATQRDCFSLTAKFTLASSYLKAIRDKTMPKLQGAEGLAPRFEKKQHHFHQKHILEGAPHHLMNEESGAIHPTRYKEVRNKILDFVCEAKQNGNRNNRNKARSDIGNIVRQEGKRRQTNSNNVRSNRRKQKNVREEQKNSTSKRNRNNDKERKRR